MYHINIELSSKIMISIRSAIHQLGLNIPIGASRYFDCPSCGRRKKFGVTKNNTGLIYQCFSISCRLKGHIEYQPSKETMLSILNKEPQEKRKPFLIPDYLITGFASINSVSLALKYNLMDSYTKGLYQTSYDPKLNRQVFFHTDTEGNVVGAMGRALVYGDKPKAHIYEGSEKTPWKVGTGKIAIIVEDILSAINCSNLGFTGVALSGITLSLEYISQFKDYDTLVIALDKDASDKAIDMRKLLQIYNKDVRILLLEKDIKDMTREESGKLIEGILS